MKKLFYLVLFSSFLAVIFYSCNKDDSVSPGGGNTNTGPVTATFNSNPSLNKVISNTGPVLDTINANITDNILSNNISDVKITLGNVENVEVDKIKFSLVHGSSEVAVIDVLTKTGVGNFINTVLWDSATVPIDQGQSPYTGTFVPQQPLSGFKNADPAGNWIIKITYTGSVKSGVIKSWGITITYNKVQPPAVQLWPAAVGNTWISERRDPNGIYMETDTFKMTSSTIYHGLTVYRIYMSNNPTNNFYVGNKSDGIWMFDIINNDSQLVFKYPINVGERWIGGKNGDTSICISLDETVVTPSGTYTGCIKYAFYDLGQFKEYSYVKPGIGEVGEDKYDISILQYRSRLFSYQLFK